MYVCFLGSDDVSGSNDSAELANNGDNGTTLVGNVGCVSDSSFEAAEKSFAFSVAEELKYEQRYEEGYDLPDPRYEEWLRLNHPEAASRPALLNCTPSTSNPLMSHLAFEAGEVSPVQISDSPPSVSVTNASYDGEPLTTSTPELVFTIEEETKYLRRYEEGYDLPDPRYEEWLRLNHPEATHSNVERTAVSISTAQDTSEATSTRSPTICPASYSSENEALAKRSPFSDLLNSTSVEKPKLKVTTGKARVLTSAECLKALQEKENEKRRKAEEKEQRKLERIEKKKQREEEMKKKQEERARRKDQVNRKRKGNNSGHGQPIAKRPSPEIDTGASSCSTTSCPGASRRPEKSTESVDDDGSSSSTTTCLGASRKSKKSTESVDDEIDVNRCCVCFGTFTDDVGTGREWLQCKCTRWIHEECIDDDDVNIDLSKLCPLC